ncbi:MAG: phosphopantetheine-binding protein [Mycoplasmataceae bacterium]|jgi:acyl carrier protein|nr:phosphopantetheine-binding protein [Mycoplasmataceae bacterium]
MSAAVLNKLKAAIKKHGFSFNESQTKTTFKQLGIDSIRGFTIIMDLEDDFGVQIPEDKLKTINTPEDLINIFDELLKNK